jgi:hypothetical protein
MKAAPAHEPESEHTGQKERWTGAFTSTRFWRAPFAMLAVATDGGERGRRDGSQFYDYRRVFPQPNERSGQCRSEHLVSAEPLSYSMHSVSSLRSGAVTADTTRLSVSNRFRDRHLLSAGSVYLVLKLRVSERTGFPPHDFVIPEPEHSEGARSPVSTN